MISLYQIFVGAVIGLVQGISEWLPISSKTQVLITSHYLLGLTFQQAYALGLFMEGGGVLAAVIYFRKELVSLVEVLLGSKDPQKRKLFVYVFVVTLITGIIGAPLYLAADSISGIALGIPMVLMGLVLLFDAFLMRRSRSEKHEKDNIRKFDNLTLKDYGMIGISQGIAALPGVSRSGITTSAMLLMKVEPDEAFKLSFLVGIFAAVAASALTLVGTKANVSVAVSSLGIAGLATAVLTSIIVSFGLISFLIKVASKSKIVYLTLALGVIAIISGGISLMTGIGG